MTNDAALDGAAAPTTAVRVFVAFLAARAVFGVVYLVAAVGHPPIPWYYPLLHAWEITAKPGPQAMGWFGLTAEASVAALVVGWVSFLVSSRGAVGRALTRTPNVLALAHAGALVLIVDFTYFGWSLAREKRTPWQEPVCGVAPLVAQPRREEGPLVVPRITEPLKLDGELKEPPWNAISARTRAFRDETGGEARPYSEARFLWDDQSLYVALYAADDDLRAAVTEHDGPVFATDDAFALHLTPTLPGVATYDFYISPAGVVADAKHTPGQPEDFAWESGIQLGVDRDGTLNDPRDMDEEWVIEAAIPWRSLDVEPRVGVRLAVEIGRCDTPRNTRERRCGSWGAPSDPRVLELGR